MVDDGRSASISEGDGTTRGATARRMVLGAQLRRLREAANISRSDSLSQRGSSSLTCRHVQFMGGQNDNKEIADD